MDSMKKLTRWEIIAGILLAASFIILAVGGTSLPCYVSIIALIVLVVCFIAEIVLDSKKRKAAARLQASMPVVTEMATIVSRRVRHTYRASGRGRVWSYDAWCMTFETTNHGNIELPVPWDVWQQISDGTRGQLKYQGAQFIQFKIM